MSNNYVQVPPNSTGVKLQTFENTVGGNTVDAEAVALVDPSGTSILGTAGTPNADVLTVQGITSGTPLIVAVTSFPSLQNVNVTEVGGASLTLGQQLAAASVPVVLPVAQITALTPPTTVAVTQSTSPWVVSNGGTFAVQVSNFPATQPVSGTITAEVVGHAGAILDGTAGSPSTGVLTVQGVSGGTAIPVANTPAAGAIFEVSPTSVANTASNPFFDAITDGINGVAAVKAASTAAVATDKALVVALSPNTGVVQGTAAVNTAGWPVTAGGLAESTAAWTSSTTVNTALQVNVAGYNTIIVTLNQGSTITGGVLTFEASDTTAFTNAYALSGVNIGSSSNLQTIASTYTLVAAANQFWIFNVAGFAAFRVRLSTAISGTATVNVGVTTSAGAEQAYIPVSVVASTNVQKVGSSTAAAALADNQANTNFFQSNASTNNPLAVGDWVYGGAFSGTANAALQGWSKMRTSTVFKTVQITSSAGTGNTAVWTPGSGNKFRLLKTFVQISDNASVAAGTVVSIQFIDSATNMPVVVDVFIPTTAVTTAIGTGITTTIDLGSLGILSAAANNVLNVALTTALATGSVRIITMGTEE
jgi:hypothetical protein